MKRVLLYYDNYCGPESRGGTEVATFRIAKALKGTGEVELFHAYRNKPKGEDPALQNVYKDSVLLSHAGSKFKKELSRFIDANHIDVIVNMSRFFRHPLIVESARKSGRPVKVIFMQHFAPGSEVKKSTYSAGLHLLKLNPMNPLYWLRASLYPLLKLPRRIKYEKAYRDVYQQSDRVVVLSDGYKDDYCRIAGVKNGGKLIAIPNIFETSAPENNKKEKSVLILSRMDEVQKRLSLALEVWKRIEGDADLSDWHLDIVGSGHNADIVKRLVRKYGLMNVRIHGWQPREPWLEKASVIMMTSEYEGLPLSLLEAQAYGCVPIAFDSFASLKDVVTPFETGVVVEKFGDVEDFAKKLSELLYDEEYRKALSRNASAQKDRFSSEKIAKEWLRILT